MRLSVRLYILLVCIRSALRDVYFHRQRNDIFSFNCVCASNADKIDARTASPSALTMFADANTMQLEKAKKKSLPRPNDDAFEASVRTILVVLVLGIFIMSVERAHNMDPQ